MANITFHYNCSHSGHIDVDTEMMDSEDRANLIDEIANNDCPECKNKGR